jgi:hypothetical protein
MKEYRYTKSLADIVNWDFCELYPHIARMWEDKKWKNKPLSSFKTSLLKAFLNACAYEVQLQEANTDYYNIEQRRFKCIAVKHAKHIREVLAERVK